MFAQPLKGEHWSFRPCLVSAQDYVFVQSLTEVYQAARLRHAAGATGMLPTDTDADPDSVLNSPFAWQVRSSTGGSGKPVCGTPYLVEL